MSDLLTHNQKRIVLHAVNETNGEIRWFPEHIHGGAQQKILQSLASRKLIAQMGDTWRLTDLLPGAKTPCSDFIRCRDCGYSRFCEIH
jgi:hypothetical protein